MANLDPSDAESGEGSKLSNDAIDRMTAQQLSRARVALRLKVEYPSGSGKHHDVLLCPTMDLKKYNGKAEYVVTYTEVEGVCDAHARTQDAGINFETLLGLARFRDRALKQHDLAFMTTEVYSVGDAEEEPKCSSS